MAAFMRTFTAFSQGQQMFSLSRQAGLLSLYRHSTLNPSPLLNDSQPTHVTTRVISTSESRPIRGSLHSSSSTPQSDTSSSTMEKCTSRHFDPALVDSLFQNMEGDLPVSDMPDPFVKDYRRCFLCEQNVKIDHKNVRLLSQFVSPYTGRIYGRAITGLCIPMQNHVSRLIKRARKSGYMPFILKDPRYLQDPQPFDPMAQRKV